MGKRRLWDESSYRSTWEDVDNWVQALCEDFGAQVAIEVCVPPAFSKLQPAVRVSVLKHFVGKGQVELWSNWKRMELRQPGSAEHWALQMLSQAWLELDLDRQAAERQAPLLS